MDLKRIRHALALAQEMNFIRAAEKVHLSQPAFSRSIQALEDELGLALFDRSKQGLAITAIGNQFLARARRLAHEARSLERDMDLTRRGEIGQVSFGAGPLPAASMAAQLMQRVRQGRPQFRVSLLVNNSRHLLNYLLNEEIEFFIADTNGIPASSDVSVTPLTREQGPFVCRAGHPLLTKANLRLQDLLPYGFAALKMPKATTAILARALGLASGVEPPLMVECDDISVLTKVVRNENLILLVSYTAVAADIAVGNLCPLLVDDIPPLIADVGIVQLSGRTLSPAAQLVIATLRTMLEASTPYPVTFE